MTILFIILIVVASIALSFIVLVQNPKGGGLAGNIAGFSNQFMGVKQTNDVLERGTWIFAGIIGLLCLLSAMFISKSSTAAAPTNSKATEIQVPAQPKPATPVPNTGTLPIAPPTTTPATTPK